VPPKPGINPIAISGNPIYTSSVATTRSAQSTSSNPPPRHSPLTPATIGLSNYYNYYLNWFKMSWSSWSLYFWSSNCL